MAHVEGMLGVGQRCGAWQGMPWVVLKAHCCAVGCCDVLLFCAVLCCVACFEVQLQLNESAWCTTA